MERKSSRPLYVMDDDYIEQKYVKAEVERQKQEEQDRIRREKEEAIAFAEAERQRKAAEAERKRKKEEQEHLEKLELAKKHREEEDRRRKEEEAKYQIELDEIEDELSNLENQKTTFLTKKVNLAKDHKKEEANLKEPLEEILQQKTDLEIKETQMKIKIKEFEKRAEQERMMLDQKENANSNRIKELTQKRREVQTQMLNFLQHPSSSNSRPPSEKLPTRSGAVSPALNKTEPTYPNAFLDSSNAAKQQFNGLQQNFGNLKVEEPSVEIVGTKENDINEQIALLDEFLATGVLTRDEYDDAKRKVYEDAKKQSNTSPTDNNNRAQNLPLDQPIIPLAPPVSNNYGQSSTSSSPYGYGGYNQSNLPNVQVSQTSTEAQIAQLDGFLRTGVLTQAEYEDAKQKVLADANGNTGNYSYGNNTGYQGNQNPGMYNQNTQGTGAVTSVPQTMVTVVVPAGKKPNDQITITYNNRFYNVVIPAGVRSGMPFTVSVPADA